MLTDTKGGDFGDEAEMMDADRKDAAKAASEALHESEKTIAEIDRNIAELRAAFRVYRVLEIKERLYEASQDE